MFELPKIPQSQHREGIQEQLDEAYDEGHRENKEIDELLSEKIKVLELVEMVGKPIDEVIDYVVAKYGATYNILGNEYKNYVVNHPNKAPDLLKDGSTHYFLGSKIAHLYGYGFFPHIRWTGGKFATDEGIDATLKSHSWLSSDRAVLTEK